MDHSELKYDCDLVRDSKVFVNILVLFLPFPLFWALSEQQGSRWLMQGLRMNGETGIFKLQADQMQLADPLLNLIFIPLFDVAVYPLLKLVGIQKPLQKITVGGFLASFAFICSMTIQLRIEQSPDYSVNILWQLPQYAIMSMAEVSWSKFDGLNWFNIYFQVMFVNTGLEFVFTQAPQSMKSVLLAFWMVSLHFSHAKIIFPSGSDSNCRLHFSQRSRVETWSLP